MNENQVEQTKEKLTEDFKVKRKRLSTGLSLLNLACSGKGSYGLSTGHYYLLVGDSASGKTFLSMTVLAEASINKRFDGYRLIYDDVEGGAQMNISKFFGKTLAKRIESPSIDINGEVVYSESIEEFYYHVDDACDSGKPFIYILDSMDCLSSDEEDKNFEENKKNFKKHKEDDEKPYQKGSYGDGKAKKNSASLRRIISRIKKTNSILIVICQTRDNIGAFSFDKKTRSGGKSLRFYASIELWLSSIGQIKKSIGGKERQIGINSQIQVKKNRATGQLHKINVPIFYSYGMDDIGSCIDFLVEEKHWKKLGKSINTTEFGKLDRESLIEKIEEEDRKKELVEIVENVWNKLVDSCSVKRKDRYNDNGKDKG